MIHVSMSSVEEDGCADFYENAVRSSIGRQLVRVKLESFKISYGVFGVPIYKLVCILPFRPIPSDNELCRLRVLSGVGHVKAGANRRNPRVTLCPGTSWDSVVGRPTHTLHPARSSTGSAALRSSSRLVLRQMQQPGNIEGGRQLRVLMICVSREMWLQVLTTCKAF